MTRVKQKYIALLFLFLIMTGCNSETVNTASDAALFTSESNVSGIKEAEDDSDEKSSSELDATAAQDFEAAPAEEGLKKNTEPTEDAMDNTAEAQNQQGLKTDNNIWSGHASASIICTFFCSHNFRSICPISFFSFPYISFLLNFGAKTIWY